MIYLCRDEICSYYYDFDTGVIYVKGVYGPISYLVNPDGTPRLYPGYDIPKKSKKGNKKC